MRPAFLLAFVLVSPVAAQGPSTSTRGVPTVRRSPARGNHRLLPATSTMYAVMQHYLDARGDGERSRADRNVGTHDRIPADSGADHLGPANLAKLDQIRAESPS